MDLEATKHVSLVLDAVIEVLFEVPHGCVYLHFAHGVTDYDGLLLMCLLVALGLNLACISYFLDDTDNIDLTARLLTFDIRNGRHQCTLILD